MRVVTVNLWNGGGQRVAAICAYLRALAADACVLTEYRSGTPAAAGLAAALAADGYRLYCGWKTKNQNTVAIAARDATALEPLQSLSPRWLGRVKIRDIILTGIYAPQPRPANDFHERLTSTLGRAGGCQMVVGDWNAGLHFIDERSNSMTAHQPMMDLHRNGWVECWLYKNGIGAPEYSWFSPARRNGFRIDQAFVSEALVPRITSARYDQAVRLQRLSDHAPLIVDFAN